MHHPDRATACASTTRAAFRHFCYIDVFFSLTVFVTQKNLCKQSLKTLYAVAMREHSIKITNVRLFIACITIKGSTWIAITFHLGTVARELRVSYRFFLAHH